MENNKNDNEIIILNPELVEAGNYVGAIKSIHTGFVFIDNVKRGYETINTNGDVFCNTENATFEIGQLVEFHELNTDTKRVGKFRTESITLIDSSLEKGQKQLSIMNFSKTTSPYHDLKKIISEEDLLKAGENKPLAEFIQQMAWLLNKGDNDYRPEDIIKLSEDFIAKNFSMLTPLGFKCNITQGEIDQEAENRLVDENVKLYNESGLQGQAASLKKEYAQFLSVRSAFTLMNENNLLNYSSVLEIRNFVELFYSFPVCFTYSKESFQIKTNEDDPQVDHVIKFFSDCIGSKEFRTLYQIYNRRTRPISQFIGKDIMPPNIVRVMNKAKELFDYVTIMTPYHDMSSREWSNSNWLRNIDPILVGFIKDMPTHFFILGRWSQTGIFPLLIDCIADTSNHLKLNKHLLKNFQSDTYWYNGKDEGNSLGSNGSGNRLEPFADKLLLAYENGLLFPFLRGELANEEIYRFPN
ncbi:MAG: hypothetical protein WCI41_00945 [bacterium]